MINAWSFWLCIYLYALDSADKNHPTLYSSRIDGAVLPCFREEDYTKWKLYLLTHTAITNE